MTKYIPLIISMGMRVAIVLSKFIAIFYVNKAEGIEAVGVLGLGLTIVAMIAATAGLEFYQRQIRKTAKSGSQEYSSVYQANLFISLVIGLFLSGLAVYTFIESTLLKVLVVLSVLLEIILLDYCRFLYTVRAYIKATFINFSKAIFPIVILLIPIDSLKVSVVEKYFIANSLCLTLTISYLGRFNLQVKRKYFSKKYFVKNIVYARYFILTSVSNNLHDYADRLILANLLSPKLFGVYMFALTIVNASRSIVFFGPVTRFYPYIIKDIESSYYPHLIMLKLTLIISFFIFGVGWFVISIPFLVNFFEFPGVLLNIKVYSLIFVFVAAYSSLYYFHYILYAANCDKANSMINIYGAVILSSLLYLVGSHLTLEMIFMLKLVVVLLMVAAKNIVYRRSVCVARLIGKV